MSGFEEIGEDVQWNGKMFRAGVARFRFEDGEEVSREKVWHPGAVGVVALDDEHVWLTRQPREAIGAKASLEIPAGKLDVPGEKPLETAKRELGEEIGKAATGWEEIIVFYTSPGFSDERVWLYLATGLSDDPDSHPDEGERIEIVRWPLGRLEQAISETEDSKTLIALLWLAQRRAR
jgi:8-oxo-dGTP pyrophosphatase MutT (NUDIX family)